MWNNREAITVRGISDKRHLHWKLVIPIQQCLIIIIMLNNILLRRMSKKTNAFSMVARINTSIGRPGN